MIYINFSNARHSLLITTIPGSSTICIYIYIHICVGVKVYVGAEMDRSAVEIGPLLFLGA